APECRADWTEILERFCIGALDLQREGSPFERIGRRPAMPIAPRHTDGAFVMPRAQATLIYGPQGVRKSTIAQAAVVGTVTGVSPLPRVTFDEGPVMVLDWEASAQEWNDRTMKIAAGARVEAPEYSYRRCARPLAEMVEEVAAEVMRESSVLLVVDAV